jgi:hypothetical protein
MVEVAAGRRENLTRVFVDLVEMSPILCRECGDLAVSDDSATPTAKDELPSVEMAQREDALAFHASVSDLDIGNHGLLTKMMKMFSLSASVSHKDL